jgi:hypothetical protein
MSSSGAESVRDDSQRDTASETLEAIEEAHRRIDAGDHARGRHTIEEALSGSPDNIQMAVALCWQYYDDPTTRAIGVTRMRALYEQHPAEPDVVAGYLTMLRFANGVGAALEAVGTLPEEIRASPRISSTVSNVYLSANWRFRQRAVMERTRRGRSERLRFHFSRTYWRTGGPLRPLRRSGERLEEEAEATWSSWRTNLQGIADLPVDHETRDAIRSEVDDLLLTWATHLEKYERSSRLARRPLQILLLVMAIVYSIVSASAVLDDPAEVAVRAAIIVTSALLLLAALDHLLAMLPSRRAYFAGGMVCWLTIVGGYAVTTQSVMDPPWSNLLRSSLVIVLCVSAVAYAAQVTVRIYYGRKLLVLRRANARATIIDALLDGLKWAREIVGSPYSLTPKRYLIDSIERASQWTENELAKVFEIADPETEKWVRERAAGVATALRRVLRDVVAATAGSPHRVEVKLKNFLVPLSTGRFGQLPYATPPRPGKSTPREQATAVARTLLVMLVPAIFFFGLSPLIDLPDALVAWGRVGSFVWFLLYLAVLLDPDLKSKLELARGVSDLVQSSKPDNSSDAK